MNNERNNFMDSKTIMAVVITGLFFFGYQYYLKQKYPDMGKPAVTETTSTTIPGSNAATAPVATPDAPAVSTEAKSQIPQVQEKLFHFENEVLAFDISSKGMGLKNFTLKKYFDREGKPVVFGLSEGPGLFEVQLVGSGDSPIFNIVQKTEFSFEGTAQVGGMTITRQLVIDPENGATTNKVFIQKPNSDFKGLAFVTPEKKMDLDGGSFLLPSFEHQEFVVNSSSEEERLNVTASKDRLNQTFSTVGLAAIASQYFTAAVVDKSEIIPEVNVVGGGDLKSLTMSLLYKPVTMKDVMELNLITYAGPKAHAVLQKIDPLMTQTINFGFFASIGKGLLWLLRWFHSFVGNWGVAIIFLTILVRIIVLPLNVSTFRSSKKMAALSPKVTALRERLKDNPQAMNQEMMALWKENGVNPLGGCLPMLLQLPIFFAYYQVLSQSIELYQAPFIFWIKDLSIKDPYYVLPFLMAVAMWIQQKITPTAMDPAQARILQWLPLVFAFMMVTLPSGLTLYIFINTAAGVVLQQIFMTDRKNVPAKAK